VRMTVEKGWGGRLMGRGERDIVGRKREGGRGGEKSEWKGWGRWKMRSGRRWSGSGRKCLNTVRILRKFEEY